MSSKMPCANTYYLNKYMEQLDAEDRYEREKDEFIEEKLVRFMKKINGNELIEAVGETLVGDQTMNKLVQAVRLQDSAEAGKILIELIEAYWEKVFEHEFEAQR